MRGEGRRGEEREEGMGKVTRQSVRFTTRLFKADEYLDKCCNAIFNSKDAITRNVANSDVFSARFEENCKAGLLWLLLREARRRQESGD